MVQGSKCTGASPFGSFANDPSARKASYEAIQKREQERKSNCSHNTSSSSSSSSSRSSSSSNNGEKYGAWGSVYKNKQHFAQMHFC